MDLEYIDIWRSIFIIYTDRRFTAINWTMDKEMKKHLALLALTLLFCFFAITSSKAAEPYFNIQVYLNEHLIASIGPEPETEPPRVAMYRWYRYSTVGFAEADFLRFETVYSGGSKHHNTMYACVINKRISLTFQVPDCSEYGTEEPGGEDG